LKTKRRPATRLSRRVSAATVNHLKALFARITTDSCTPIGEWTDYACLWSGRKYTMHKRVVTVLWCCAAPTSSGGTSSDGGSLTDFIAGTDDSDCAEVMTYGPWLDTGAPCLENMADEWVPRGPLPAVLRAQGARKRTRTGMAGMHRMGNGRARRM